VIEKNEENEREGKRIVSPGALLPSHLIKMYNTGDDEWDRKRK